MELNSRENVRLKVFLRWFNSYLHPYSMDAQLLSDFYDGRLILSFFGIFFGEHSLIKNQKQEKLVVLRIIKEYLVKNGFNDVSVIENWPSNESSMLFVLSKIVSFCTCERVVIGDLRGRIALLSWTQRLSISQHIDDFTQSWVNGVALCEILSAFSSLSISETIFDPKKRIQNFEIVIQTLSSIKFPLILDPNDFSIDNIDEDAIVLFLSELFFFLEKTPYPFPGFSKRLVNDDDQSLYEKYNEEAELVVSLSNDLLSGLSYELPVDTRIELYKSKLLELNKYLKTKRNIINEAKNRVLYTWNELLSRDKEEKVRSIVGIHMVPEALNKAIYFAEEKLLNYRKDLESFLFSFVHRYNGFIQTLYSEYNSIETQLSSNSDGFGQRRSRLNESRKKLNDSRSQFDEIENMYLDVKRANTTKLARKTPEEIRARYGELLTTIDQMSAMLENDIRLSENLRLTDARFSELRRCFQICDTNRSGSLEIEELRAALTVCGRKFSEHDLYSIISQFGDGNGIPIFQFLQMMSEKDNISSLKNEDTYPKANTSNGKFFLKSLLHV